MEKRLMTFIACLFLSIGLAMAQSQVSGTVTSAEDGAPVVGASVKVVGTHTGTATDADGHFSLNAPANAKLQISYIGMATQTVKAGRNMDIKLEASSESLSEFVVTGYGTARKLGTIAGSVETISGKTLENRPIANVADAMQGQVAGLQVMTSSGEPSATASMRIRGVTSINASTEPLFILDGSEISQQTFLSINPNDIESMTTLKDASSTAIYGSRAANGVIIVTTKKGKFGEAPTVSVSAQYGISRMTGDKADMMDANQWLAFQEVMDPSLANSANFQAERAYYKKYNIGTDWNKFFFSDSKPTSQIDVSVRGGSQNTAYLLSYGHYKTSGIIDDSNMRRETLRANLETNINPWLKIGSNTNLAFTKYRSSLWGTTANSVYNKTYAARIYLPTQPTHEVLGLDPSDYANSTFEGYGEELRYYDMMGFFNPMWVSSWQPRTTNRVRLNENVFVNLNPIKGLNIRTAVGLDANDLRNSRKWTITEDEPDINPTASAAESFSRFYRWTVTNTAEYKFNIAKKHDFTVLLGQESMTSKTVAFGANADGITDNRLSLMSAGATATVPSHSISEEVRNSWFGMLNYSYADRYFLDLSIRRDGSSLFGENNRWATFGAAAVMWKICAEDFMAPSRKWLKDLNLKASFGSTGNSGISPYLALGLVGSGGIYDGNTGTTISNAANPDLSWEKVKATNVGLNGNICNVLDFNFEFYNKVTSDMLMAIPYSYTTGFSGGYGNVASMRNRGFDFDLNARIIRTKDWHWSVRLNGNYNKNEVTDLFQGLDSYILGETGLRLEKGKPYGEFYMVRYAGVDPMDGQNIWLDKNGNKTKVYSEDDKVMTGKQMYAPWSGGLSTTLSWKGLALDVQFTGMFGRYMTNNERFFTENGAFASENNQTVNMLNMWMTPGQITDIPAADADVQFDTHLLEKASFVRLKTLQLSYSFPKHLMKATGFIKDAKIYFIGRNLLTFTPYTGYDPEVDSNITLGNYPNTRQVSIGAQLTF